jgi:hypothetical protein
MSEWERLKERLKDVPEVAPEPTPSLRPVANVGNLARFALKFPDKCCAEVTRRGNSEPCDATAVAVAASSEEYDPGWWPVCRKHLRGRELVPLEDVLAAFGGGSGVNQ